MPLPTAKTAAAAPHLSIVTEPVKRDFNNLDELLQELNTPKEQILSSQPAPGPTLGAAAQEYTGEYTQYDNLPEPISPESAAKSGARIAKTFDTVFAFGASMYAKSDNRAAYGADQTDIKDLSEAWSDVAMKYSFKIEDSPWLNVIILMLAVYSPLFLKARADHRFAVIREEMEENRRMQEIKNAEILERLAKIEEEKEVA